MRDFFNQDSNTSPPHLVDETPARVVMVDTGIQEPPSSLRSVPVEEEEPSNLPKIVGGALAVALLLGGGIYAYHLSTPNNASKQVAIKTEPANKAPVPVENADAMSPAPVKSASEAPPPVAAAPVQPAKAMTPGFGIGPSDDPNIDAPMTHTAENAPPAQKEGVSAQVAAEAPSVSPGPSAALRQPAPALGEMPQLPAQ